MSIKIEQLDNECKNREITVLVGKNILLKFIPSQSILDSDKRLQSFIKTPNLLLSDLIRKTKTMAELSKRISDPLSRSIRLQDIFKGMSSRYSSEETKAFEHIKRRFEHIKRSVVSIGGQIGGLEKDMNLYLAKDYYLYFCSNCDTYLADSPETLPINCRYCGEEASWGESNKTVRFLDGEVAGYLDGLWFEDYIAKFLKMIGWKTWCHGHIMGSSGVDYQIDVLAINSSDGRVLVGECKSGQLAGKDVFNFSAQYFDIKSNYGFFFSLKGASDPRLKEYMKRTPGLCLLDGLESTSDEDMIKKIKKHLEIL